MIKLFFTLALVIFAIDLSSQQINPTLLTQPWQAQWIAVDGTEPHAYGVYKFRKSIELPEKPDQYIVHVSGDNQYKLFVNGQWVSLGPDQGDVQHWYFRTLDLAPYLKKGTNILESLVWNMGNWRPEAQISHRTGFILQGNTINEYDVNTNATWTGIMDSSYAPIKSNAFGYYVAGPGEFVNRSHSIDKWSRGVTLTEWKTVKVLGPGAGKGVHRFGTGPWMLVPTPLPPMELKPERLLRTRYAKGFEVPQNFPEARAPFSIPSNTSVSILLDQTHLTNAYPTLVFGRGKSAEIGITYAEALYDENDQKNNRDEIEGKRILGRRDSIISNGEPHQEFTPLSWRTYRYVQLNIQTHEEPLLIDDFYGTFIGYPFHLNANLITNEVNIKEIFDIGWRTARLCAVDTYMDCPYYERLQYIGDTRIQAMVSYFNSGDDRLAKHAINLLDYSRLPEGVTQSRYPATGNNIIPPFSLLWIGMLSDFYQYRPDAEFVKTHLNGMHQVLTFFQSYQQEDGSLKNLPYWNFTDWVRNNEFWNSGVPPLGKDGSSSLFDLQLLMAYQIAANLEGDLGSPDLAKTYKVKAAQLKNTIKLKYWDQNRGLFADRAAKDAFSQHANILAILTESCTESEARSIGEKLLSDPSLAPASIYFRYYLNLALVKAGLGDLYLKELTIWKQNMDMGLTTWAEISDVSGARSDCHAWGSSPNIEFFRTVLGISSGAPGFKKVVIQPHLGDLQEIGGEMPHPSGIITIQYRLNRHRWEVDIHLPETVKGTFIWENRSYEIGSGSNHFELKQ